MINDLIESRPTERADLPAWYEAVLRDQEQSGVGIAEYATRIGVTGATLYNWRRRLSPTAPEPGTQAPGLVRVRVHRGATSAQEEPLAVTPAAGLIIRVGSGRSIELAHGFDAEELARALEVLESC